jgi:2-amino-4-hydroxy-6-hydroxymethyldihydropteridine diphosphokinase
MNMTTVYLDIGSNIDREKNIQSCVDQLCSDFEGIVFSKAYESEAFGFDGEAFINLSAKLETELSFDALNVYLKSLESKHARKRDNDKFIDRTLDVDILLYGDLILQPEKDLPRKEILKFPFVLFPLAEIAGEVIHPVKKITISKIVKNTTLDKSSIKEVKDFPLLTIKNTTTEISQTKTSPKIK